MITEILYRFNVIEVISVSLELFLTYESTVATVDIGAVNECFNHVRLCSYVCTITYSVAQLHLITLCRQLRL